MADLSRMKVDPELLASTYSKLDSLTNAICSNLQKISEMEIPEYTGNDAKAFTGAVKTSSTTLKTKIDDFNAKYLSMGRKNLDEIAQVSQDLTNSAKKLNEDLSV